MSDFRNLLSTFQAATNTSSSSIQSSSSHSNNGSNEDNSKDCFNSRGTNQSLKQRTERLWQISNIRKLCDKKPQNATKKNTNKGMKLEVENEVNVHIAVCAVIVDLFPHEHIWRRWMESGDEQREETQSLKKPKIRATSEFYIHAKYPEAIPQSSTWLKSKVLSHSFRPNWNDVKVVRAMLALLDKSLLDPRTTHILFCTESCIPITSLHEAATTLVLDPSQTNLGSNSMASIHMNRSFINAYDANSPACTRFDEYNCFGILEPHVPNDAIWKALPGWILLSRKHAMSIKNLPYQLQGNSYSYSTKNMEQNDNKEETKKEGVEEFWTAFEKVWAPEEVYFPTALALCGHLPGPDIVMEPLTHAEWDSRAKDHKKRANPKAYDDHPFTLAFVNDIRNGNYKRNPSVKCLFMRKWKQRIDDELWAKVVLEKKDEKQSHSEHRSKYTQTRTKSYEHSFSNYSDHGRSRKRNRYHDDESSIHDSGGNHYEGRNHLDSNQERQYSRSFDRNQRRYNSNR